MTKVEGLGEGLLPNDDWPFLYLRERTIPRQNLIGLAIMGGCALALSWFLNPRWRFGLVFPRWRFGLKSGISGFFWLSAAMFFLGAGFMLLETKAVVHMALLFGSTWLVNAIVFAAVLIMILAANVVVLLCRGSLNTLTRSAREGKGPAPSPARVNEDGPSLTLRALYVFLALSLLVNCLVPLDWFLGMSRAWQVGLSCLLVFFPVGLAGIIFALLLVRHPAPERALGINLAGAMAGGFAEYASLVLGFRYLLLLAMAFYLLSALGVWRGLSDRATGDKVTG